MKRYFVLAALLWSLGAAAAVRYTNPILHQDWSDPDVCRAGDCYYMTASSFNFMPGLPVLRSRDLVNWELTGAALPYYPFEGVEHGRGVWAPAIRYHEGWFMIFVGDPDRGIFMVRAKDPSGPWEKPVWLWRGKGYIDPCPFWDDDGKAYLSHAAAGSRAGLKSMVFVAPMAPDGTALLGPSRAVFDGHDTQPTIEGTKFYKRQGKYYIFCPAGGVSTGWQTVLRADSPWGPWEDRVVMAWAPGTVNGPHQGAWVETPSGDWFLHFQDKGAYGRIVHLQPMKWGDDLWPVIGEDPDGDGVGQPVGSWEAPLPSAGGQGSGRRSGKQEGGVPAALTGPYGLTLDWQYPTEPQALWHFPLPDGGFRLYSVLQQGPGTLWDCPNVLSRKFPAESFSVEALLVFRPLDGLQEDCGFGVFGNDYAVLRLRDSGSGASLEYAVCAGASHGGSETVREIAVLPWSTVSCEFPYASGNVPPAKYPTAREATLRVRLEVHPEAVQGNVPDAVCQLYWSTDGKRFTKAGEPFTARPELWTGARFGFWCNRARPKNDGGRLEVSGITLKF